MPSKSNSNSRPPVAGGDELFALKGEANQLCRDAHARGEKLSHMAALEQLAHSKGFRNWNALHAHATRDDGGADASKGSAKLTGVAAAVRRREIMDSPNGGFMMGAERFVDTFARDGWALIESLEAELRRAANPDLVVAHGLLSNELHHRDVLTAFKASEQALGEALRGLSDAAAHHEKMRLELEAARQRWDADAAELSDLLRKAGSWVEECRRAELRAAGWPMDPRALFLPDWVAAPLMKLASPDTYPGRAGLKECVEVIMETLSNQLMAGHGSHDVKLSELMGALDKLDRQHTIWQEAETKLTSAKNAWVTAEHTYVAQRRELVSKLDRLSDSSRWELLCLVFPNSVERAKTPSVGRYDYRWGAPRRGHLGQGG
jgi:hypothetical protein